MMADVSGQAGWGPAHDQERHHQQVVRRRVLSVVMFIAFYVVAGILHTNSVVLVAAVVVGIVVFLRVGVWLAKGAGGRLDARAQRWASDKMAELKDPVAAVHAKARENGGGVYLGCGPVGSWVHARPERAVLVLGPPRSGKTTAVIIPAILAHTGPVVSTSTKPDVANAVRNARRRDGRVWVFDPTGSTPAADGEMLRWSPVRSSADWDGALLMARAMTAGIGQGTTNGSHWARRAQALLAPLLHAAANSGESMETVVDWVMRHELDAPGMLLENERTSRLAFGSLVGLLNTEARERASIFSAAADAIDAYSSEAALQAATDPNFDPDRFVRSGDSIFIHAPAERQHAAAPIVCGLLAEIRRATYAAHARQELYGRVLFALDEAANIAPLDELPQIASEGGGQGLQLLVALQDLSQARVRWGAAADGFLTLFGDKLLLRGIADTKTLEAISVALGEYDRRVVSHTRPSMFSSAQQGRTHTVSTQRTRVLSPGEIAGIPTDRGLHLDGLSWELIDLTPAHRSEPWRTLLTLPAQ